MLQCVNCDGLGAVAFDHSGFDCGNWSAVILVWLFACNCVLCCVWVMVFTLVVLILGLIVLVR